MHHTETKVLAILLFSSKHRIFCCCELNQILKRPNSGIFEGMGGVGSFLVEIIPLFNLSHGRKCPFGSLAPCPNFAPASLLTVVVYIEPIHARLN